MLVNNDHKEMASASPLTMAMLGAILALLGVLLMRKNGSPVTYVHMPPRPWWVGRWVGKRRSLPARVVVTARKDD